MTGAPDWHHGRDRGERDAAAQREWWEHARLRKEVDVFSEAIFERQNGFITSDRACPARILAAKYPSTLPGLLRQFLKATNARCPWEIAQAIGRISLPKETRIRVLSDAARQGSLENRRCLIQILAKLDAHRLPSWCSLIEKAPARFGRPLLDLSGSLIQIRRDGIGGRRSLAQSFSAPPSAAASACAWR